MLKTPVAIVRNKIGYSVQEFARLISCAVGTVQRLERNDLKLSDKLAWRIQEGTGAPADWLLKNDPTVEPVIPGGLVWNEEVFEVHQGKKTRAEVAHKLFGRVEYARMPARERAENSHRIARYLAMRAQADIHGCLAHAILKGDFEFEKAVLTLNRFLTRLDKEFGSDEPTRELYAKEIALEAYKDLGQPVLFTQHGKNYRIETDGKISEIKSDTAKQL